MSLSVCLSHIETKLEPDIRGEIYSPFYPSLLPPQCSCSWKFKVDILMYWYEYLIFLNN